jgi:hypothetical protein
MMPSGITVDSLNYCNRLPLNFRGVRDVKTVPHVNDIIG